MYHSLIDVPYGACVAEQDGGKEEINFFLNKMFFWVR